MTKTIKICDRCGKECYWLFTVPIMHIKGYTLEICEDTPNGTAHNEFCEDCAQKAIDRINDVVLHHNF